MSGANMALPTLTISKNWFTGTNVREVNWDNIRTPLVAWSAGINGGITQISRDAFGSSYVVNQNGSATLSKSLQQQINEIGSGTTPFTGDVKIYSGFDLLLYSDAGTTLKFSIDGATGNAIARGNVSLYSGGDLALFSDAGTTLRFAVDGATGNTFLYAGADFTVFSDAGITAKFFIDGATGNTSLYAGADFSVFSDDGITSKFFIDGATGNFGIPSTQRFYLDGTNLAGDTYLHENAANSLQAVVGGNTLFTGTANMLTLGAQFGLTIPNGRILSLADGTQAAPGMAFSTDSTMGVYRAGARILGIAINNTAVLLLNENGTGSITAAYQLSLPNVDPPASFNYQTQSSGVKGYIWYQDGGTVESNYNIDSITDDDGDGVYDVNWDTDAPATAGKTSMCCTVTVNAPVGQDRIGQFAGNTAVGTSRIIIWDVSGGAPVDDSFTVTAFGG